MTWTRHHETKLRMDTSKRARFDIARLALAVPISVEKTDTLLRVQGKRVIMSEKLFEDYDYENILAAFIHGIMTILLRHEKRSEVYVYSPQERMLWVWASEACISSLREIIFQNTNTSLPFLTVNSINHAMREVLPGWNPIPEAANVEEIYLRLRDAIQQAQEAGIESIMGGMGPAGEEWSIHGSATEDESVLEGESESILLDSAAEAALRDLIERVVPMIGRGLTSMHGELRYFHNLFHPDYSDVQRLSKLLHSLTVGGKGKPCLSHRRKRKNACPQIVLFQTDRRGVDRTAVIADVSGSTYDHRERLMAVLAASIRACDRIDAYIGDTTILEKKVGLHNISQVRALPDGGGTDMANIIEEVDGMKRYRNIVVVSDGHTGWPTAPVHAQVIYFPFGDYTLEGVPPWIKIA